MKFGVRKPSIKKTVKAKTIGKAKRAMKSSVNPLYGKKGTGLFNDPQKSVYNKAYNKTTVSGIPKANNTTNSDGPAKLSPKFNKYIRYDETPDKVYVDIKMIQKDIKNLKITSICWGILGTVVLFSKLFGWFSFLFFILAYILMFVAIIKRNNLKILYRELLNSNDEK